MVRSHPGHRDNYDYYQSSDYHDNELITRSYDESRWTHINPYARDVEDLNGVLVVPRLVPEQVDHISFGIIANANTNTNTDTNKNTNIPSLCEARATPTDSHHEPGEQESQITYHRGKY